MVKLYVTVHPNSSQEKVVKVSEDGLAIYTRAKPKDGEANQAVIDILAKYFKVAKTRVVIRRGLRAKHKTVEILV